MPSINNTNSAQNKNTKTNSSKEDLLKMYDRNKNGKLSMSEASYYFANQPKNTNHIHNKTDQLMLSLLMDGKNRYH
jgi:hypothetical protein